MTPFNFSPGILRSTTAAPTPILDWPLTHFLDGVGSLSGSGAFGAGVTSGGMIGRMIGGMIGCTVAGNSGTNTPPH